MITFAGVELCFEDAEGQIAAWIERFLPLEDLRDQTGPAALRSQRPASRSDYQPGVNLPLPNYPDPPQAKLSTLYWPSGAARWARGYFLASGGQLAQILPAVAGNAAAPLVLRDPESGASITAQMNLLPPRNLSAASGGDDSLYLLPLVDDRYFWQLVDSDALKVTTSSTWSTVFDQLQTQLSRTLNLASIASAYGIPDPDELTRPYENAALLLDAAAHSVGMMVVVDLDGTVNLLSATGSAARYTANLATASPIAGGDFSSSAVAAVYPEKVVVSFQKWREGAVDPGGDVWNVAVSAASLGFATSAAGLAKIVHSTAFADFTSKSAGPDNAGEVNALAQRIASDYYGGLAFRYDLTLPSIYPWAPTGFDDHVAWTLGGLCGGQYVAHTRAQCLPYNFGEEEQLQQFIDKPVYPSPTRFTLKADLIPSPGSVGSAAAVHRQWNDGASAYQDTTDNLTVFDSLLQHPGLLGQSGLAVYKGDSLRWEASELDNRFLPATLDAYLPAGGTSSATIAGTGTSVPVTNWPANADGQAGDNVYIRWEKVSQIWYTWPISGAQESIITTWPWPPDPPTDPTDPNPPFWSSELALAVAQSSAGGYDAFSAMIVRGAPTTLAGLAGVRNNPINVQGPAITVNNWAHPIIGGELVLVWGANSRNLPASRRYWVVSSEFGGRFITKNTSGGAWSKGSIYNVQVYAGVMPPAPGPNTYGLANQNVYMLLGDIPDGKWAWVNSTPNGWLGTAAEC